jgi:AAA15 family ATPase/GTPase
MLVEFRLRNFRSYAAEKKISMVAATGKELAGNTITIEGFERHPLLRSAAIYGANASGKSNLVQAFDFFQNFVLQSSETHREGHEIPVLPFLLDPKLAKKSSELEITFLLDGVRHQYGFIVSPERVSEEWLTVYPKGKPQEWFRRIVGASGRSEWSFSRTHMRGDKIQLADRTRENALFLTVAAQWNHPQIKTIYAWFENRIRVLPRQIDTMTDTRRQLVKDAHFCDWAAGILRAADTGISGVYASTREINKDDFRFPNDMSADPTNSVTREFLKIFKLDVRIRRRLPGSDTEIEWDLEHESDGTQRMLELLGPIRDVLEQGAVLIMDELDTSLHAFITRAIVRLFNNPDTNPNGAQLVFTTHDTSLLDLTIFRRDQIWLTEKDQSGATDLYSLQDYSPRKGEAIQKGYLLGRYGAVPFIGPFEFRSPSLTRDKLERVPSEG